MKQTIKLGIIVVVIILTAIITTIMVDSFRSCGLTPKEACDYNFQTEPQVIDENGKALEY